MFVLYWVTTSSTAKASEPCSGRLPTPQAQGFAHIFGYPIKEPQRYGVVEADAHGIPVSIEEKTAKPTLQPGRHRIVLLSQQRDTSSR